MKTKLLLFSILLYPNFGTAQSLETKIKMFGQLLLMDYTHSELVDALSTQDIYRSQRLGISYHTSIPKHLISYLPPRELSFKALNNDILYELKYEALEDNFGILTIQFDAPNNSKYHYYFKGDINISPISYFTRNWPEVESKYFHFKVENSSLINEYSMAALDAFVDSCGAILELSVEELSLLEREKIIYVLASSENSILNMTGYASRGQYNLAYDAIITTYNAHYHEIVHLLVNYKIRKLPLYSHPFLQEGVAVALGGRGGLSPAPLFTFADFALESGFTQVSDLVSKDVFSQTSPSISYPIAGFVLEHLIDNRGIDSILTLYKKYSNSDWQLIPDIPKNELFNSTFDSKKFDILQTLPGNFEFEKEKFIDEHNGNSLFEDSLNYYFSIHDTLLLRSEIELPNMAYKSSKFVEVFPHSEPQFSQYLVVANNAEIAIYDLYTNTLLTNFVAGFQNEPTQLSTEKGAYHFKVDKKVFKERLTGFFRN